MQKHLFFIIALLCMVAQGAWAQTEVSSESALTTAISGGTTISVKLTENIALSNYVDIPSSKTVTIDLNGHKLDRGLSKLTPYGIVIRVENGGTLTVKDSGTGGTITGGYDATGGGICVLGTLNFESGTISGCYGTKGGAVYTTSDGTVNMTGGTITGNTATDGGGIYNNGTLTISGGTIQSNNVTEHGGGAVTNYGTLTINGGSFTNNSGMGNGGGIWSNQNISMQGLVTIKNNTGNGGSTNNLYLAGESTKINVTGAFTEGTDIHVSLETYKRTFTSGFGSNNSSTLATTYFTTDVDGINMGTMNGEIILSYSTNSALYVECSWSGERADGHLVKTTKLATVSNYSNTEDLSAGWYLLSGDNAYSTRPRCHGDVKFILKDGCNVEFEKGIHIDKDKTLTIYCQSYGSNMGKLRAIGKGDNIYNGDAAIGGNNEVVGGNLVIHGGDIYAEPDYYDAAGIGGGDGNSGMQSIIIYGGTVEAQGSESGAGIGGGLKNNTVPDITIYGGTVIATGGNYAAGIGGGEKSTNGEINICGGTITAKGGNHGAGIGGGEEKDTHGTINIWGGTINATGGEDGAGIGSGHYAKLEAHVYVYGGTVTAKGGAHGAGIGYGYGNTQKGSGEVIIEGGTIYATGGTKGAGIGSANSGAPKYTPCCFAITISGGYVEAQGGEYAAGISGGFLWGGGTTNITGGTVKVKTDNSNWFLGENDVSFIGRGGKHSSSSDDLIIGTVNLGNNHMVSLNGTTKEESERVSTCQSEITSSDDILIIQPCTHSGANYTIKDSEKHKLNCQYCKGGEENHDTNGDAGCCSKCGYGGDAYTITFYEANAAGTGYGDAITYQTGYQVTFTLPECSSEPKNNWGFVGWEAVTGDAPSLLADDSELSSLKTAGSSFKVSENVTYYARYRECWNSENGRSGTGTQSDPYQINNKNDWDYVASKVNNSRVSYKGKYFKLTANVGTEQNPVTTMIGAYNSSDKYFAGNFNGGGHKLTVALSSTSDGLAPFGTVSGGTIRNLVVTGSVSSTKKNVAGLIACINGDVNVSNCHVSTAISTTNSGDVTSGGFVAYARKGNATYTRCVFDGSISASGTSGWGGFVGWTESNNSATSTFTNCLFKPSSVNVESGNTFARYRNSSSFTITGSYYTSTCGDAQGTQAYTIESGNNDMYLYYGEIDHGDEDEALSDLQQLSVNEIYPFDNGLLYQGKFYTGGTTEVTFTPLVTLDAKGAYDVTATPGTLTANNDGSYTITMNSADVTVTATIDNLHYDALTLYDASANTATIATNEEKTMNVTISGRTLYKDGDWNTLCLPFAVSEAQITAYTDFSGCTIMELDTETEYSGNKTGFDATNGTLYLYFKTATAIEARKPYLIKWTTTGDAITSPVFNVSYIESSSPKTITSADGNVSFKGNFDPVNIGEGGDDTKLYLGADDKLYYPSGKKDINSFRAYFQLNNGLTAGNPSVGVRAFVLNFGEDETTGIVGIEHGILNIEHSAGAGWYDLSGRKLSGKPTQKGIYIYNGKKRVIK